MPASQRDSKKQVLVSLLIQKEKDRFTTCLSWRKLTPRCQRMVKATNPLKSNSLLNDPGSSIFWCQSDHDSTLFEANGITLKPAKKFHHDFNVQHIARIEAKQLKVSGELENLEKKKETFDQVFKGLTGHYVSKKRKLKQNRRKSKGRKRKRFENNVLRVYHICVVNPLSKELPNCLFILPPWGFCVQKRSPNQIQT